MTKPFKAKPSSFKPLLYPVNVRCAMLYLRLPISATRNLQVAKLVFSDVPTTLTVAQSAYPYNPILTLTCLALLRRTCPRLNFERLAQCYCFKGAYIVVLFTMTTLTMIPPQYFRFSDFVVWDGYNLSSRSWLYPMLPRTFSVLFICFNIIVFKCIFAKLCELSNIFR
jgi:hypothetical protein